MVACPLRAGFLFGNIQWGTIVHDKQRRQIVLWDRGFVVSQCLGGFRDSGHDARLW